MINWTQVKTVEQKTAEAKAAMQDALTNAVQAHLDKEAKLRGYDDIKSAVTYAEEPSVIKFQQEGQNFRAWRSKCWEHCYALMAEVEAGTKPAPTVDELIAGLPVIVWSTTA